MTRARVAAQQLTRPPRPARLVRGTVSAVSPLTVQLAGGGAVAGVAIPGAVYTVGAAVLVLAQEPAVGPVYPLTPQGPAFSALPIITALDTAPDGYTFLGSGQNPFGDGGSLVSTVTTSVGGTVWRMQRITSEQTGMIRTRVSWAGVWGAWTDGTTTGSIAYSGTFNNFGGTRVTRVTRRGPLVTLNLSVTVGATAPPNGSLIGTISAGFRPSEAWVPFKVSLYNGAWNGHSADVEVSSSGTVTYQAATIVPPVNSGLWGTVTYLGA